MPWQHDAANAGFTGGRVQPWLPIPAEHVALSVDVQRADPASVLNRIRQFVHWRRTQPCLLRGEQHMLDAPGEVVAFVRKLDGKAQVCAFNLGAVPQAFDSGRSGLENLSGHGFRGRCRAAVITLPPHEVFFGMMDT